MIGQKSRRDCICRSLYEDRLKAYLAKTTDYDELAQALEDRFAPANQTELYRVQLRDRRQRASETLAELGQDIRRLANLAYPSAPTEVRDTLAKEQFIDSLVNSDLRLKVKQARPTYLNDAVRHAVELEAFFRTERRQQEQVRVTTADRPEPTPELSNLQSLITKMEGMVKDFQSQRARYRPPVSYQQNERVWKSASSADTKRDFENRKRDSPPQKKRLCFECGSDKHLRSRCPVVKNRIKKRSSQSSDEKPATFRVNGSGCGTAGLFAKALVDGMDVSCLIDTGATVSLVSKNVWHVIESNHHLSPSTLSVLSAS
ncbi:hypothetical protein DPMN_167824 [Dreissena polymorpha]|uniref:CCHC-type domain-containing protein n=1 Tax=Dreissena polymorpha TaxID=45954 RepID=A0A9D4EZI9_DREPO|nr:hypothetical protein DPMN_167824 [Dreissena polymorpha]